MKKWIMVFLLITQCVFASTIDDIISTIDRYSFEKAKLVIEATKIKILDTEKMCFETSDGIYRVEKGCVFFMAMEEIDMLRATTNFDLLEAMGELKKCDIDTIDDMQVIKAWENTKVRIIYGVRKLGENVRKMLVFVEKNDDK